MICVSTRVANEFKSGPLHDAHVSASLLNIANTSQIPFRVQTIRSTEKGMIHSSLNSLVLDENASLL